MSNPEPGATDAFSTAPTTTSSSPVSATGSVVDPVSLVNDLVKALENNSSPQMIATYVGELVALVGITVGAFDHPLGLSISAVPQAVILGLSGVLALGMGVYRLFAHTKTRQAALVKAESLAIMRRNSLMEGVVSGSPSTHSPLAGGAQGSHSLP